MTNHQWVRIVYFLALLLLVPLLGFVAVKGYYWYQVRSEMARLTQQVSLLAKLEYGSIETGFNGVVGIHDLVLTPLGQDQGISIDSVRVKAPGWWDLVNLQRELDKGELPQALGVEISGFKVGLANPALQQLAAESAVSRQTLTRDLPGSGDPWVLGCEAATAGLDGLQLLRKLGYQQLDLDFSADYVFDRSRKLLINGTQGCSGSGDQ